MFKRASGLQYRRFLRRLHAAHLFDWYLELDAGPGNPWRRSAARPSPSIRFSGRISIS